MDENKGILSCILLFITLFYSFTACSEPEKDDIGIEPEKENVVIEPEKEVPVEEDTVEVDSLQDIKEWFDVLCSAELGGRYSGSEGIRKAVDYISNVIGRSDSLEIDTYNTDKCEMRNIIFHIKGENDSLVVLGAHYDAYGYSLHKPFPGADDNMSGVAVLLKLIKILQEKNFHPKYSFDVCFYDGEEIGRYGSKRYVDTTKKIKMYINIDTCGNCDSGLGVYCDISNPYLKEMFKDFIVLVKNIRMKVADYKPVDYVTDCEPFVNYKIPYVNIGNDRITGFNHTMNDDISHISYERILSISSALFEYISKF